MSWPGCLGLDEEVEGARLARGSQQDRVCGNTRGMPSEIKGGGKLKHAHRGGADVKWSTPEGRLADGGYGRKREAVGVCFPIDSTGGCVLKKNDAFRINYVKYGWFEKEFVVDG